MSEQVPSNGRVCPAHGAFPGGCCHMCGWSLDDEMPSVPTPYIGRIDATLAQWRGPGQEWAADDPKVLLLLNLLNGVLLHSRRTSNEPPADLPLVRTLRIDRIPPEEFARIRAITDGTVAGSTFRKLLWQIEQLEAGVAELIAEPRAAQPPETAHLGRGDAVRIGANIRGEYSKTMTITHVMYVLNHGAATVPDDAVVRATSTKEVQREPNAFELGAELRRIERAEKGERGE